MADENLTDVTPHQIKEVIKSQLGRGSDVPGELPLFIWGPPGIGKSNVVAQAAAESGVDCIDFRLTLCDPSDLRGIPVPDPDGHSSKWLPPSELPNGHHAERGVLFFDDLPTAPPLVQTSAYQIVLHPHRLGDYQLPPGWIIVAAGNRASDKAMTHKMSTALESRFTHLTLRADLPAWTAWAAASDIHPDIVAFLNSPAAYQGNAHLLWDFDPQRQEHAFPCPRTWEGVSHILEAAYSTETEMCLVEGTVGMSAAAQFMAFRRLREKLPPLSEILERRNFGVTPKAPDLRYVMVSAIAAEATEPHHLENAIDWVDTLGSGEFGALLIKLLAGRIGPQLALKVPAFKKWATANRDLFVQ